ncbi:MAG: DUF1269 domain-containing protein [Pseudomonadota bacterium]
MSNSETPIPADPVIAVHDTHTAAEATIRALSRAGFDMKKLSIIGKGYHTEEHALGFYTVGDRIKTWGGIGGFWGAIWGLLLTPAVFVLPPVGLVGVAGPLVVGLMGALEGAAVVGGLSALGAALFGLGLSRTQAIKYEADVKADRYLVIVHGSEDDIATARAVLRSVPETDKQISRDSGVMNPAHAT